MRNTILQELHAEYEQRQQQNQREEARRRMQAEAACPEIGQVLKSGEVVVVFLFEAQIDDSAILNEDLIFIFAQSFIGLNGFCKLIHDFRLLKRIAPTCAGANS